MRTLRVLLNATKDCTDNTVATLNMHVVKLYDLMTHEFMKTLTLTMVVEQASKMYCDLRMMWPVTREHFCKKCIFETERQIKQLNK